MDNIFKKILVGKEYLKDKYEYLSSMEGDAVNELLDWVTDIKDYIETYHAVQSEVNYQERMTKDENREDIIENFNLGDALSAMRYNLDKAQEAWYNNAHPHQESMEYIRKITALGVRMGKEKGMPHREVESEVKEDTKTEDEKCTFYPNLKKDCRYIFCKCKKYDKNKKK
jgi:hypothetical protein